jgi:hypothetical protein
VKRLYVFAFLLISFALPALAAKSFQSFYLPSDVRAGSAQIPQGNCEVSWTQTSGSDVQLTIKVDGKKPVTVAARLISEKHPSAGISTVVDKGITYLQDFHTTKQTFIIPGVPSASGE